MRYFNLILSANSEQIQKNSKIRLRDYSYDNNIAALNSFMYQKMKNDMCFLVYREEDSMLYASFVYNERKSIFDENYSFVLELLNNTFSIKKVKEEPQEITMHQFLENLLEGRRRDYINGANRYADATNLWIYYYGNDDCKQTHFSFREKIISDEKKSTLLYDDNFLKELENIESHENDVEYTGNIVHYIISSRSVEAAGDMTETLMKSLIKAKRLSSRRMEIITDIDSLFYKGTNHVEELIENNYGGAVVFDLSEKFGTDPANYATTCQYIENLVKKYRNQCLFVFTYNMDKPGFSYNLLPNLNQYVIPVMLREGTSDRRTAIKYMKQLIKASKYAEYSCQANEFMNQFPGEHFSQTDVLMAFEQFEAWCLNRNVLKAYDYQLSDDFMLDRDENVESAADKLHNMIGLDIVKKQIQSILASDIVEKERKRRVGTDYRAGTMHMVFSGNPGSAKTTVAKLFAAIAKEKGLLKSGAFVECSGVDFDSVLCVESIRKAFASAKGGVLFIDEAYAIKSPGAITVLIQEMENHREDVIVIFAGYHDGMKLFMQRNEGIKSRIPHWIDFPDYDENELTEIFKLMLKERGFTATEDAMKQVHYVLDKARHVENFGNGRYVRNLLERAIREQSVRLLAAKGNVENVRKSELFLIKKEDIGMLDDDGKKERQSGTARNELQDMIGLSSAKAVINKAIANYKLKKFCLEKGIPKGNATMHMVFTGNPGTAKTTVARLFAEIMKDEKVMPTGNFVEVGRADLVGQFVGSTAPLVKKKFKEAKGGVLFIDEAYSLCDDAKNSYGDEAINTIVQEMENHREDVIVIFAGYPKPMQEFLDRNPGMASRIAFRVDFEDYTTDELCEITKLMLSKKQMTATDAAMAKLREHYESARQSNDYGNGRFVRKMLEEAEMNLAERIFKLEDSEITTDMVSVIDECDIPEPYKKKENANRKIGFCA